MPWRLVKWGIIFNKKWPLQRVLLVLVNCRQYNKDDLTTKMTLLPNGCNLQQSLLKQLLLLLRRILKLFVNLVIVNVGKY